MRGCVDVWLCVCVCAFVSRQRENEKGNERIPEVWIALYLWVFAKNIGCLQAMVEFRNDLADAQKRMDGINSQKSESYFIYYDDDAFLYSFKD